MDTNFLTTCFSQYSCGSINNLQNDPYLYKDTGMMTPYVTVSFYGGNSTITVGNQSSPSFGNEAVIKSFDFGTSNGLTMKVEIMDEEGGSFYQFADRLNKCITNTSDATMMMYVKFGWIATDTNSNLTSSTTSPWVTSQMQGIPQDMQINYEQGKIKYIITATDVLQPIFASRHKQNHGTSKNTMKLTDAIRQLFRDSDPKVNDIKYLYRKSSGGGCGGSNGGSTTDTWKFDPEPSQVWEGDTQDKLSTAMRWIKDFTTSKGKGITPSYDALTGNLIFWEDGFPDCSSSGGGQPIGTWLVNGGALSNVLSFTPKINYVIGYANKQSGGSTAGPHHGKTAEIDPKKDQNDCGQDKVVGIRFHGSVTRRSHNHYGKNAIDQQRKAEEANEKAGAFMSNKQPIEAELKIRGNPRPEFTTSIEMLFTFVSIIVINPFHIKGNGNAGCGDWLAYPACNPILSNKSWQLRGVSHSIREGSYTTTLNLSLPAPGIDIQAGQPFGGSGSGTYIPKTC